MNYLFYVEPLIEMGRPYWKECWASDFSAGMIHALQSAPNGSTDRFVLAVNEPIAERLSDMQGVQTVVFTQEELLDGIGCDYLELTLRWYRRTETAAQSRHYSGLVRRKLGDFIPDMIIVFSPAPFLAKAFPQATILHQEFGIFSRPPYPRSWYLDPLGMVGFSSISRFASEIGNVRIPMRNRRGLRRVKQTVQSLFREKSPFRELLREEAKRFDHLVLLPLQFSGYYAFDGSTDYKSQYEYLVDVLQRTPAHIGIVMTMHPEHRVLDSAAIGSLRDRYRHLIYSAEFEKYYAASQYLVGEVHAVITVSSSLAQQALLFDKKLISLGRDFCRVIADSTRLEDVERVLRRPRRSKDHILYWILTRYAVLEEYMRDPIWLSNFCSRSRMKTLGRDAGFDFFEPIDDEETIFEKIVGRLDRSVPHALGQPV